MPLDIIFATNSGYTTPSPAIWDRVLMQDVFNGVMRHVWEDHIGFGLSTAVSSNVGRYTGQAHWISYESAAADIVSQIATDANGVAQCSIAATSNNEAWLQLGGAGSVSVVPKTKANGGTNIYFECRVNKSVLTGNAFFGLAEESSAADNFIADANGTPADKDYIGFLIDEDAPTVARFVYRKSGQTAQDVITSAHTFVADTFVKLGFVIDMEETDASKRVKIYVNGEEQSTYVTNAAYEAATFPTGEELTPIWGGKNVGEANIVRCDWLRCAQKRES